MLFPTKEEVAERISKKIGLPVAMEKMSVSIFTGKVELQQLRVGGKGAEPPLAVIGTIKAQLSLAKAMGGQIHLDSLDVADARIHVIRRADGSDNLPIRPARAKTTPVANRDEQKPSKPTFQFRNMTIGNVDCTLEEQAFDYRQSIQGLSARIEQLPQTIRFQVSGQVSGSRLELSGDFSPCPSAGAIAASALQAKVDLAPTLSLRASTGRVADVRSGLGISGHLDAQALQRLIPPSLDLARILGESLASGQDVSGQLVRESTGWRLHPPCSPAVSS